MNFSREYFEKHITTIMPMVNVDLLIRDKKDRLLLAWRDDGMFLGWHIPGRIIRFKESFKDAIINCCQEELGYAPSSFEFVEFFENIKKNKEIRGHFITFVYNCHIPNLSVTKQKYKKRQHGYENGYLKWFAAEPLLFVNTEPQYKKYFKVQ